MAIDFSLSELVALSVESFFYGTLPPSIVVIPLSTPTASCARAKSSWQGFTLCSSLRLSRRSSISARRSRVLRHCSLLPVFSAFSSHGLVTPPLHFLSEDVL